MKSDTSSFGQPSTVKYESALIDPPELEDQEDTLLEKIKTLMSKMAEWIEYLLQFVPFVNSRKKRDVRQKDTEKFEKKKLKIFIGTWNMHGKLPPYNLNPFIEPPSTKHEVKDLYLKRNHNHPYHILVIGTQECQHNIKHSVLFPSKEEWEQRLKTYLGDDYILVKTETMAALHLAVFVWERCKDWVKDYQHGEVPTGFANLFGNKGGIGISLLFGNTSLCFINSHLADKVKERNHDVKKICKELKLKGFSPSDKVFTNVTDRFDYTFWFGDMNYRVDLERSRVDDLIRQNDIETLLKSDQLSYELKSFPYFKGFNEAPLNFYPTFKLDITHRVSHYNQEHPPLISYQSSPALIESGTLRYDSSDKQRVPSWTDRILWKSRNIKKKVDVDVLSYTSQMNVVGFSDHRPVTAGYF
ncbi:4843_t:CDS:2 [Rhizophagus irregularis]|nr:4843_t:CDS:2 [Rhizophagus irregularis]